MLKNEDLWNRYGTDIVFLFKGDEPYVETLGHPMGVLIERDNKVLCNECENWFESLGGHLKTHNLTAPEYKKRYGFNKHAPLCSTVFSKKARQASINARKRNPELLEKYKTGLEKTHIIHRKKRELNQDPRKGTHKRMQALNARNSCPEQIRQRYRLLQAKYGKDVGLNTIRTVDSGVESWAVRHYGSWNNFKEALGEPIDTSSYRANIADLIYTLREYVAKYKELPWNVYTKACKHDFPYSHTPYKTQWDNMKRALLACGIIETGYVSKDGESAKKSFDVITETDFTNGGGERYDTMHKNKHQNREIFIDKDYAKDAYQSMVERMSKRGVKLPVYSRATPLPMTDISLDVKFKLKDDELTAQGLKSRQRSQKKLTINSN